MYKKISRSIKKKKTEVTSIFHRNKTFLKVLNIEIYSRSN